MMSSFLSFFKKYRWAFLSGLLIGTSYIPFPPWALFFCYTPLWINLATDKNLKLKDVAKSSWITQFMLTLIGFHWIAYLTYEFGQLPWSIAIGALILFAGLVHIYIPISFIIGKWLQNKLNLSSIATLFVFALLLSGFERIWPSIFPWHLGYTLLAAKIPMYQWADSIGFAGLSTVILLINAALGSLYILHKSKKSIKLASALLISFFILANFSGYLEGQKWKKVFTSTEAKTFKATTIQANIGNFEKASAEQGNNVHHFIIEKFLQLTKKAASEFPETDLWMWPETAYPDFLNKEVSRNQNFNHLTDGLLPLNKPLLTGAYSKDPPNKGTRNVYNGVFLIHPDGHELAPPYHKTQLLVFGEYLPFEESLAWFAKFISFSSSFGRGPGPSVLETTLGPKIGIQICYEGLDPEFSRGLSLRGAEIITNHTNDSWFGIPFEPLQHMYMTLARAIEVRRPLIRSTNTGVSTAIFPTGEIQQKSPTHVEWYGQFQVPYLKNPPQTFFVLWGHLDYVLWILLFLLILIRGRKNESAS